MVGVIAVCRSFRAGEWWWWAVSSRGASSEGGGVSTEETPLRLAIRAREGWRVCRQKNNPLCLAFRAREGWGRVGVLTKYPSVSHFEQGRGQRGWMQRHDEERCLSLRRVGSVVACSQ